MDVEVMVAVVTVALVMVVVALILAVALQAMVLVVVMREVAHGPDSHEITALDQRVDSITLDAGFKE
jgi:hypothetical protein